MNFSSFTQKFLSLIVLNSFLFFHAVAQHPVSITTRPAKCVPISGSITIGGFTSGSAYTVTYNKDSTAQPAFMLNANAKNDIILTSLQAGVYSGFSIIPVAGGAAVNISGETTLTDQCVATQSIKFVATGYSNFVGVQDDNPTGFAQVYGRLSVPMHKSDGIANDAINSSWKEHFILFRNVLLQLTYGNTDKFKLYSFDSAKTRYVNRLDLMAHSYFNANLTFNLLTFVLPRTFDNHPLGDRMHIYLDAFTSLALTNVTDSLMKSDSANKTYNIKTPMYGFNLKGAWNEGRWHLELAFRRFWLFPATNSFNTKLNPQSINVNDINLSENASKPFVGSEKKVKSYNNIEALISYNTAANPQKNESNIFLRYAYYANSPSIASTRYSNNYFQFQIGYSFDVTQIFKPQSK